MPKNESQQSELKSRLEKLFRTLKLDVNGRLELNIPTAIEANKSLKIDDKFLVNDGEKIDLEAIINELGLKTYNGNLKHANTASELSSPALHIYAASQCDDSTRTRLLHVCSNSEHYQRQKIDVIERALTLTTHRSVVGYVCVGNVTTSDNDDVDKVYETRENYFRSAAQQRQMIDDHGIVDDNLSSLTLFSIVHDLFSVANHKDVKLENDPAKWSAWSGGRLAPNRFT